MSQKIEDDEWGYKVNLKTHKSTIHIPRQEVYDPQDLMTVMMEGIFFLSTLYNIIHRASELAEAGTNDVPDPADKHFMN